MESRRQNLDKSNELIKNNLETGTSLNIEFDEREDQIFYTESQKDNDELSMLSKILLYKCRLRYGILSAMQVAPGLCSFVLARLVTSQYNIT